MNKEHERGDQIESDLLSYEPLNLDAAFRVDGLYVTFRAVARPGMASICAIGHLVEIRIPED
jgi:hypothetical protein